MEHEHKVLIDGFSQDCSDSITNTLELLQLCTDPSILFNKVEWSFTIVYWALGIWWHGFTRHVYNIPCKPRSIPCLLMPWLLTSPGYQQPWYWPDQNRISAQVEKKRKVSIIVVLIQPSSGTCRAKYISPIVEILQNFCYSKSPSIYQYKIYTSK